MFDLPELSEHSRYDNGIVIPAKIIEARCRELLALLDDVDREGLRETPRRMADALIALTTRHPFRMTTFDAEGYDEVVVQTGIPFYSLCEHHVLPFFGTAAVAYLPGPKIVGLSKLARAVQYHAAGLQNQERITQNVCEMLTDALDPRGVAVVLRARHLCMEMRGAKMHDTYTTTSCLRGIFRSEADARNEVFHLLGV